MMDPKFTETIKKDYKQIQAPQSLYDFANQVPNLVDSKALNTPLTDKTRFSTVEKRTFTSKKNFKKSIYASITAVACSALFILGVNQSPTFANYVDKIPVLSQLSELLRFDRGIEEAVDHGYLQEVGNSSKDQGITFTLNNVISDSKRSIVLFDINLDQSLANIDAINMMNYKISDGEGRVLFESEDGLLKWPEDAKFLPRQITIPGEVDHANPNLTGMIEMVTTDNTAKIPNEINIAIDSFTVTSANKTDTLSGNWIVNFQFDTNSVNSQPIEYKGKAFSLAVATHQLDLIINYAKVYPTLTEMSMDLETELKESIFYEYHLENEDGKVYRHVEDGIMTDTGDVLPQFESSYFDQPQKLFLVIDKIRIGTPEGVEQSYDINKKIELTN